MLRMITCIALTAVLFSVREGRQRANEPADRMSEKIFAKNLCMAKGGIGIIRRDYLYVDLNPPKNTLLLGREDKWTGLDVSVPEVVVFFENKVWSQQGLPKGFDLSRAVVVSFEVDKVRFFDFVKMSGGYYLRPGQN